MNCPACKNIGLNLVTLEQELPASNCPTCGGNWITSAQYWTWLEKRPPQQLQTPPMPLAPMDSKGAKLCPECGGILIRHKVGPEHGFAVEQCGRCQGFWLDKNEWEALKACGLHDQLHVVLSGEWQNQTRREEYARKVERQQQAAREEHQRKTQEHYAQRFGPEVYAEAERIRAWLAQQPHRAALLAYLSDDDPYRA